MPRNKEFFGHPRGLGTLFFTEFWERFSYYGMRALLILFMTAPSAAGGLGWDTARAGMVYGTYTSLVYLLALPGGWVADRFIGARRATLYGGIAIMCGHISLAVTGSAAFYLGLALIVLGTGLLKPNISLMVGQLYETEDSRRDAGFSIYYLGINLGAFVAPLVTGWLAQGEGFKDLLSGWGITPETSWHWGFAAAAAGMALGLVQYVAGGRHLGAVGHRPAHVDNAAPSKRLPARTGIIFVLAAGTALLVFNETLLSAVGLGYLLLVVTLGFFIWLFAIKSWTAAERRQLVAIAVLFAAAAVFWSLFEQAGSTLNLFAQRSTRNEILGVAFPSSWWQSLNSLYIILLVPAIAWLWGWLGPKNPSSPAKFACGLLFAALGFGVLAIAAQFAAAGARVSPAWLALVYLLHTVGELCLSPVGLSAMARLAPVRVAGLVMGVWFLASAVGNYLGGAMASMYEAFALPALFGTVAAVAMAAAAAMALLIKPLVRLSTRC